MYSVTDRQTDRQTTLSFQQPIVHCTTCYDHDDHGRCRGWKLYRRVPRRQLPIHFFRHFCCRMYRSAQTQCEKPTAAWSHATMTTPDAEFSAVRFCSYTVSRRTLPICIMWQHWRQPRRGCRNTSPNILVGDVNGNIPPILLRTFGYSRPILVVLAQWQHLMLSFIHYFARKSKICHRIDPNPTEGAHDNKEKL